MLEKEIIKDTVHEEEEFVSLIFGVCNKFQKISDCFNSKNKNFRVSEFLEFLSSFYRALENNKTASLKMNKVEFDATTIVSIQNRSYSGGLIMSKN